jgi:Chromo (CHRromatin Organisation MOdifier) domain
MATFSPHSGEESGDLSPTSSASDQEGEYVVDRIIAQFAPDDSGEEEEMYLVRWEGYPDERCTVSLGDSSHIPFS